MNDPALDLAAKTGVTKTLAQRILKLSSPNGAGERRGVPMATAQVIAVITRRAGIRGAAAHQYLVDLLRWHLGLETAPAPAAELSPGEALFIRRRAWESISDPDVRRRLPALTNDRIAT